MAKIYDFLIEFLRFWVFGKSQISKMGFEIEIRDFYVRNPGFLAKSDEKSPDFGDFWRFLAILDLEIAKILENPGKSWKSVRNLAFLAIF